MIDLTDARRRVRQHLDGLEEECRKTEDLRKTLTKHEREILGVGPVEDCALEIIDEFTIEADFGWVFFWQSRQYSRSGDPGDQLVGNAPLLVSRADGSLHETGTAEPIETYIENFIRCGDPHG